MILSVVVYKAEISGGVIPFAMGLLACVAVILMVAGGEKKVWQRHGFSCKIHNADFSDAYVVCGTTEIIAAWIMKKTKWLEFFLYPNKFVKIRN